MKSNVAKTVFTLLTLLITIVNIVLLIVDNSYYTLDKLPQGSFYTSTAGEGLDKPYVVSFYTVNAGGRLGSAVRAEAKELATGKSYNVYWETNTFGTPLYSWISDTQMIINGNTIELTPDGVHFDSRTDEAQPSLFDAK